MRLRRTQAIDQYYETLTETMAVNQTKRLTQNIKRDEPDNYRKNLAENLLGNYLRIWAKQSDYQVKNRAGMCNDRLYSISTAGR